MNIIRGQHVLTVTKIHEKVLELKKNIKQRKAFKAPKATRVDPLIDPVLLQDSQNIEKSSEDGELEVMDCIVIEN